MSRFVTAICVALLFVGCHPAHEHTTEPAAAEQEHDSHALAVLGERYLAHVIHPDLVAGRPAPSLVHGTRRDEGGPISGGTITVIARDPGGVERRFDASERSPGTWAVDLELPTAGAWSVSVAVKSGAGDELVLLGDVKVHALDAPHGNAQGQESRPGVVDFYFESQWPLGVRFERVERSAMSKWDTVAGRIDARPGTEAHAVFPVSGRLIAPEGGRLPRPGDRVSANDVLGVVEPHLSTSDVVGLQSLEYQQHQLRHELDLQRLEADRALGSARVRIQAGERELARAERLFAQTLATQQEVDRARSELELARSDENAALASLESVNRLRNEHAEDPRVEPPRLRITAPISGVVGEVDAVLGESVDVGGLLAVILDTQVVWAVAEVPEHALSDPQDIVGARIRPLGSALEVEVDAGPTNVAPRVSPMTRCVEIAFAVENEGGRMRPGTTCTIRLRKRVSVDALSVPPTALIYERGRPHVFVMIDGEKFEKRRIRLGERDGDRFQVVEGLAAGEVVVATHADELRLAALSGSGDIVEHHH